MLSGNREIARSAAGLPFGVAAKAVPLEALELSRRMLDLQRALRHQRVLTCGDGCSNLIRPPPVAAAAVTRTTGQPGTGGRRLCSTSARSLRGAYEHAQYQRQCRAQEYRRDQDLWREHDLGDEPAEGSRRQRYSAQATVRSSPDMCAPCSVDSYPAPGTSACAVSWARRRPPSVPLSWSAGAPLPPGPGYRLFRRTASGASLDQRGIGGMHPLSGPRSEP
jgi:hypothetical protein